MRDNNWHELCLYFITNNIAIYSGYAYIITFDIRIIHINPKKYCI